MRSRARVQGGYATVTAEVEVDVSEVLEEAPTEALTKELRSRAKDGDIDARFYLDVENVREHDKEAIQHAIVSGAAQDLLAIMTRLARINRPVPGGLAYADLPRDIVSRRPLVL